MSKTVVPSKERARLSMLRMSRKRKRSLILALDVLLAVFCGFLSLWLTFGFWPETVPILVFLGLTAGTSLIIAAVTGYYRSIIRFIGVDFVFAAAKSAALSAACIAIFLSFHLSLNDVFRTLVIFFSLQALSTLGIRYSARLFLNKRGKHREPVLIYGAGEGGIRLVAALRSSPVFLPVAFIDDNPSLSRSRADGLDVYPPSGIKEVAEATGAERVLLAIPSATRRHRRRIIESLEPFSFRVQTIPDVADIVSGKARVDDIRDIPVEDLLGRDAVPPNEELLRRENTGATVLVTGAGGSIGSELCQQVVTLAPVRLLLVERSEIALYTVEKRIRASLQEQDISVEVVALLGCVTDKARMKEIMHAYSVDTVYHAAAYKHVPIVEHNIFEGIINNVVGTLSTAEAALECRVRSFVLVSTDKAVSPTNVMGASKRLSELVLQDLANRVSATKFCMVRFGNVLASSGSVVPLFKEQISKGGPVTVTHPEIIRYFMTIPEAAQLVVQAGAMAKGGDVFVLDMGEPVKIVDLAKRMIHLLGLAVIDDRNPDGDIEIVFSGLRPAEKLYEELLLGTNVTGTRHPRIMRANERFLSQDTMSHVLSELRTAVVNRDGKRLTQLLLEYVEGYSPTGPVEDHILVRQADDEAATGSIVKLVNSTTSKGKGQ